MQNVRVSDKYRLERLDNVYIYMNFLLKKTYSVVVGVGASAAAATLGRRLVPSSPVPVVVIRPVVAVLVVRVLRPLLLVLRRRRLPVAVVLLDALAGPAHQWPRALDQRPDGVQRADRDLRTRRIGFTKTLHGTGGPGLQVGVDGTKNRPEICRR